LPSELFLLLLTLSKENEEVNRLQVGRPRVNRTHEAGGLS